MGRTGGNYIIKTVDVGGGGGTYPPTGGVKTNELSSSLQSTINSVSGKYIKPSGGIPLEDLDANVQAMIETVSGSYSKPPSGIPVGDLTSSLQSTIASIAAKYTKPEAGIPSTDLSSGVQSSLASISNRYVKPAGGIPTSDLDSSTQSLIGSISAKYTKPGGGIPASDLAFTPVQTTRSITAGSGLTGGGDLSSNRSLSVDTTVVRNNATVNLNNQELNNALLTFQTNANTVTTYTLTSADNGKMLGFVAAGGTIINLPANLPKGFNVGVAQEGTGRLTVVADTANGAAYLHPDGYTKTRKQGSVVSLFVRYNASGSQAAWVGTGDFAA